ncbi:MAG: carboxypeptidase-like regulatory domain-containing protein [Acidobacteria bacterium]|nr:carboxypeptidase-like regulatory domain-containing protein [Acidobacteriota bacterium]MCA1636740.1 carboxypeptidase-like regulatory domain-containing protein [Acidobacteriota bacterium]
MGLISLPIQKRASKIFNRDSVTDIEGQTRSVITNPFGYFRFEEVPVGETYIFTVSSKRYRFTPQVISVNDEISELIFTAEP